MTSMNIRQSFVRLAAIVTITTGLLIFGGTAAALHLEVGLTECDRVECRVITRDDLGGSIRDAQRLATPPTGEQVDHFRPHVVP